MNIPFIVCSSLVFYILSRKFHGSPKRNTLLYTLYFALSMYIFLKYFNVAAVEELKMYSMSE